MAGTQEVKLHGTKDQEGARTPKVTVLVTLYNKGPFVAETIRSVLANTWTDLELLIVDDASSDEGPEVVRGFSDERIRFLPSAMNTGRGAAANRGYDAARGEYIAVIDADDLMHPERIARQVEFLDANPEVVAVGSWIELFGVREGLLERPLDDDTIRAMSLIGPLVSYPACMLRRSVIEEHGIRCDPTWLTPGMDHLFLLEVQSHGRMANIPAPLTRYREGEQNMRHGRDPVNDMRLLVRRSFEFFDLPITEDELELQLMLHDMVTFPQDAEHVRAFRAWLDKLIGMNREKGVFPVHVLEPFLEQRWRRWFFRLVDEHPAVAWAHIQASPSHRPQHTYYLLNRRVRRMLGQHEAPGPER
ncbi:MAG: glycosyltransferase family 2 protein [Flavobacteriales bacterium]|nr:glycosyltransferase family 2 protein [Flavobacteriales bacterium]